MKKEKLIEITTALNQTKEAYHNLQSALSSGPATFYFDQILDYYYGCMAASKFKEGDRVKLKEDVDTSDAPGWNNCKHFLIKGAQAVVTSVDYRKGKFYYDIIFDVETYISTDGDIKPVSKKHTFCFQQRYLKRVKD